VFKDIEGECHSPPEGFLLPIPSQRDLRAFRRVLPSRLRQNRQSRTDSYLTLRVRRLVQPCSADTRRRDQMVRRIAAVVLALTLNPALARAQDAVLTVTVLSADVHKGPSTVTPVIGRVPRGAVLPVSRNLGSWVKVAWPDAPEGVGYVHVTMGRLGPSSADASAANTPPRTSSAPASATSAPPSATSAPASATSAPASATTTIPPVPRRPAGERIALRGELTDTPIGRIFGVGGLVESMSSFGATARAWRGNHLGIQLAFTRDAMTSGVAAGRVTSMGFEPGVVYALFDHVSDYIWIRPYVGSVLSFRHQTLKVPAPAAMESASDNGIGFRVFGGSELTLAAAPWFGLSAELGYRRFPTPFPGFEADRLSVSIAAHWYIK
jgi:uncharacterized protein YraI